MNNQYAVSFEGVSLIRNKNFILNGVDLNIEYGGRCVILGLNGSGKTSLLRLIAGFDYPSDGNVSVLGSKFGKTDIRELRKRVGWVHSDLKYDIPSYMSVEEVIYSGKQGSLVVYDKLSLMEKRRVIEALERVEADNLAERKFYTLSTGERQRVLIARALFTFPDILLLDEPCLGLDPVNRESFLQSLSTMLDNNKELTVIYVTHHIEEIVRGFNRIVVIARGRIVASGSMDDVINRDILSTVYGDNVEIRSVNGRFYMHFE